MRCSIFHRAFAAGVFLASASSVFAAPSSEDIGGGVKLSALEGEADTKVSNGFAKDGLEIANTCARRARRVTAVNADDVDIAEILVRCEAWAAYALIELSKPPEAIQAAERALAAAAAIPLTAETTRFDALNFALRAAVSAHESDADWTTALAFAERSVDLNTAAIDADPFDDDARWGLVLALTYRGDVRLNIDGDEAAAKDFAKAKVEATDLTARHPRLANLHRDSAILSERLGDVERRAGALDAAERHYRDALALHQDLIFGEGASVSRMRDKLIVLARLAELSDEAGGDLDAAAERYRDVVVAARVLRKMAPESPATFNQLSSNLRKLASVQRRRSEYGAAIALLREALELSELTGETGPNLAWTLSDLAVSLRLGGDPKAALPANERAVALYREDFTADPDDPTAARNLSVAIERRADTLLDLKKPDLYADGMVEAAKLAIAAARLVAGEKAETSLGLAPPQVSTANLADVADAAYDLTLAAEARESYGDLKTAIGEYDAAVDIFTAILTFDPTLETHAGRRSWALSQIGGLLEFAGKRNDASRYYRRALSFDRIWVKRQPDSRFWRRNLAISLRQIGALETASGAFSSTFQLLSESANIHEALTQRKETAPRDWSDLSRSQTSLTTLLHKHGYGEKAVKTGEKALASARRAMNAPDSDARATDQYIDAALTILDVLHDLDRRAALVRLLEEYLPIAERRAQSSPQDPDRLRAVMHAHWHRALVGDKSETFHWREVIRVLSLIDQTGRMTQVDLNNLADAQENLVNSISRGLCTMRDGRF
ncbi:MAG: tetratricopeptide repeat protein [Pseudomonadota bacterium]